MSITTNEVGIISKIISSKVGFNFKPSKTFYNSVKINQKRFGIISKNQKSPTLDELKAICLFFEVDIKDYIN